MTYRELYQNLFDAHMVSPFYSEPMQPPFPKWYDANTQCEYYVGITGHSIENCTTFKKLIERLIRIGIVKFGNSSGVENLLPNHTDKGVNAIIENAGKRIKKNITEVKTPLKWVLKQMIDRRLIIQNLEEIPKGMRNYCEFHTEECHEIQECAEFKVLVQSLMDNKELVFFEEVKGPERILGNLNVNAVSEEGAGEENLSGIFPCTPGNILNGGTVSSDINNMSDTAIDLKPPFEQDRFLEEPQDFEDNRDCSSFPDLLRMV
ncbi:hypothetical protein EPI10_028616 [Gossypium australe]|uniref:Uncharacterized protein n=1 Tax=Gossypium australe TaxID=47621 RepID=A0A5B6UYQ4_9ROSI|nr:hypothetical protein EPI10_028616 [Gossypium australe]